MTTVRNILKRAHKKISRESYDFYKKIRHTINHNVENKQSVLFIMGCQRSGTTLLTKIFNADRNTSVYGEFSKLSSADKRDKIRLNPHVSLNKIILADKASFVVAKPLVESQNALRLLESLPYINILWMYRDYKDVASSNLTRFGEKNGINNINLIINNDRSNWRSENISIETKELVREYYSEDMSPLDAAALFWYVRNSLFFHQNLQNQPRVMICNYQDLVEKPESTMNEVYLFSNKEYPGSDLTAEVHKNSLQKGDDIQLTPSIEQLCEGMLLKLEDTYKSTPHYKKIRS